MITRLPFVICRVLTLVGTAAAKTATFAPLGHMPGGTFSRASAASGDGSVVVGQALGNNQFEAFRWTSGGGIGGLGDLPGSGFFSKAAGVSADGSVVVGRSSSGNGSEAFRWTSDGMVGLGDLPGGTFSSDAVGVSADGSIVVGNSKTAIGDEAFVWDEAHGMRNLRSVLVSEYGQDLSGWTLTEATAISADGTTIVGLGTNPLGQTEAWRVQFVPVPEPATPLIVVAGGLLGRLLVRRKQATVTTRRRSHDGLLAVTHPSNSTLASTAVLAISAGQ